MAELAVNRYRDLLKFILGFVVLGLSCAHADNLPDRLNSNAFVFDNPANALYLDMTRVGNNLIAVGERGVISLSSDHGKSWLQTEVPTSVLLTSVFFIDSQYGWAAGHSGVILHTQNGGESWVMQFDGNQANEMVVSSLLKKKAELQRELAEAEEYDIEDLEYAIEDIDFALEDAELDKQAGPSRPLLDIWFRSREQGYAIGAYGLFFETRDGGATWQYAADKLENFERFHLNAMSGLRDGTLLIVGEAGAMFASYDDGDNWEALYGPYQGSYFGLIPTREEQGVLAYGLRGHAYKSVDGGAQWSRIATKIETTISDASVSSDGTISLVGYSGVVLESQNDAESFDAWPKNGLASYTSAVYSVNKELIAATEYGLILLKK